MRSQVFRHPHYITRLVNEAHIPLADLLQLDPGVRSEVFQESIPITQLMNEAHIPLDSLLRLDQDLRAEVFGESDAVVQLVNKERISFEQLSTLSVEELRTVACNPRSAASQQILNPSPSSSFRLRMP